MPILVQIKITREKLILEIPEKQIAIQLFNQIAYDPKRHTLLAFGKSEKELQAEIGSDWQTFRHRVAFARIFDPQATGPIFDYRVLELMFQKAANVTGNEGWHKFVPVLHPPVEITAQIQDYELLSLGRRRELEYYLLDFQRAQHLWINERNLTIPQGLRTAQHWTGMAVRVLIPGLLLFGGFLTVFNQWGQEVSTFVGKALVWFLSALLGYFLGTSLWLISFRKLLPHGYLRYQLRTGGTVLRKLTRWLADKIL